MGGVCFDDVLIIVLLLLLLGFVGRLVLLGVSFVFVVLFGVFLYDSVDACSWLLFRDRLGLWCLVMFLVVC